MAAVVAVARGKEQISPCIVLGFQANVSSGGFFPNGVNGRINISTTNT